MKSLAAALFILVVLLVLAPPSAAAQEEERFDPCEVSDTVWHLRREARKRDAPAIDWVEGWWIADGDDSPRTNTLYIGGGDIVRNGYVEDMFPKVDDRRVFIHRSGEPDYQVAELFRDGDTLQATYRGGKLTYRKVEQAEYEKAEAASHIDVQKLLGFWVSERLERADYPFATLVSYQGKGSEWPAIMIGWGLSLNGAFPAMALLYGIFDLTPEGKVLLRGGNGLNDVILELNLQDEDTLRVVEPWSNLEVLFHRSDEESLKQAQTIKK